jgi:predicted DNA-binding transcriptional regulator YafY
MDTIASRERVRAHEMAKRLGVSVRKFYEIKALGMPYTELQGILWFEPEEVHRWLDRFARKGEPGAKGGLRARCENRKFVYCAP